MNLDDDILVYVPDIPWQMSAPNAFKRVKEHLGVETLPLRDAFDLTYAQLVNVRGIGHIRATFLLDHVIKDLKEQYEKEQKEGANMDKIYEVHSTMTNEVAGRFSTEEDAKVAIRYLENLVKEKHPDRVDKELFFIRTRTLNAINGRFLFNQFGIFNEDSNGCIVDMPIKGRYKWGD